MGSPCNVNNKKATESDKPSDSKHCQSSICSIHRSKPVADTAHQKTIDAVTSRPDLKSVCKNCNKPVLESSCVNSPRPVPRPSCGNVRKPEVPRPCGCAGGTAVEQPSASRSMWPIIDHVEIVVTTCRGNEQVKTSQKHCTGTTNAPEQDFVQVLFSHYGPQVKTLG